MKFLIQLAATVIVCLALQYFLPWWTLPLGAFAVGFVFRNKGYLSFFAGFLGAGLLWLGMALIIDFNTQSILTQKVNQLLPVNALLMTTLVGGLVGGLGGMTGALLSKL